MLIQPIYHVLFCSLGFGEHHHVAPSPWFAAQVMTLKTSAPLRYSNVFFFLSF